VALSLPAKTNETRCCVLPLLQTWVNFIG
jgi:hypothetical protein